MAAALDDLAVVENEDLVRTDDGREPMGDRSLRSFSLGSARVFSREE